MKRTLIEGRERGISSLLTSREGTDTMMVRFAKEKSMWKCGLCLLVLLSGCCSPDALLAIPGLMDLVSSVIKGLLPLV